MKRPLWIGCFALLFAGAMAGRVAAQSSAAPAAPPANATAGALASEAAPLSPEAAAAKAEFDRQFAAYKQALLGIEQLRTDYQGADEATREQLNQQLVTQVTEAQKLLDGMIAAAQQAYRLAPNTDPQITELLLTLARYYAVGEKMPGSEELVRGGDHYERALPIIATLIEGGAKQPQLPLWGLVAAYTTNDFDLAQKYAELAEKSGVLSGPPPKDPAEMRTMALALEYSVSIDSQREKWAKESAIREAEAKADDLPRVLFKTSKGDVVIELFENEAPQAVASFLTLVKDGYYDGLTFHRVLPKFMAQGGDPKGDGSGGPGYSIRCEIDEPNARKHFRGSLSMAHAGRDTGGSQFFLTFVPTSHLDGKHTVFGRVVEGIEVLGDLQQTSSGGEGKPQVRPDEILEAEVIRDRGHEYTFEKLPGR